MGRIQIIVSLVVVFMVTSSMSQQLVFQKQSTSPKLLVRQPASGSFATKLLKGRIARILGVVGFIYTSYDISSALGVELEDVSELIAGEQGEVDLMEDPLSLIDPDYQPRPGEIMPRGFVARDLSAPTAMPEDQSIPSEPSVAVRKSKRNRPQSEDDLEPFVYPLDASGHLRYFSFEIRDRLLEKSLAEAKVLLGSGLYYQDHELSAIQRAFNFLHTAQFIHAYTETPRPAIADFQTCAREPRSPAFPVDSPSEVSRWPLVICHHFHELSLSEGSLNTPVFVGSRILSYIVLKEAGMSEARISELVL